MALYEREKTGVGRRLDVAMVDTLFSVMKNFVVEYTIDAKTPYRAGNQGPSIAPFDSFQAKDGAFVMGCGTDKMFAGLCGAMGRTDLIENPLYKTNLARCENYLTSLKSMIERWTQTKTIAELEESITKLGIPFGVILTIPEAAEHPQLQSRNMLWHVYQKGMEAEIRIPSTPITKLGIPFGVILTIPEAAEHPQLQSRNMLWHVYQKGMEAEIRIPSTPIKIHGEQDCVQKGAPLLGEDNDIIYGGLLSLTHLGHMIVGANTGGTIVLCLEKITILFMVACCL